MTLDFNDLIASSLNVIQGIARSYADRSEREDLTQEILLQLWKSRQNFRGQSNPKTWLYRVAINTAISGQRKAIRVRKGRERNASLLTESFETTGLSEEEILKAFLSVLGDVDRAIFRMYADGLSARDMGEVLGMQVNAINVRVARIKRKFEETFVD